MKYVKNFFAFWYHFLVGDDYRIALGVVVGLSGIGLLVHYAHLQLWWLMPIVVMGMLSLSVWLDVRRRA